MKTATSIVSLLLLALWSMSFSYPLPAKNWEHLGSRNVKYHLEKDVIHMGAREGGFTKLKLSGGHLHLHRLGVEYASGHKERIKVKHHFGRAAETRAIDLNSGKRVIKDIVFWYDTENRSSHRAKIHVFGKH